MIGGGQVDHLVGEGDEGGPMRDHDDGPVAGQLDEGVGHDVLGERVEVGGRLVEQDPGPVAEHDPGEGEAGPLAGGERRAVLGERGGEPSRELPDALFQGDPAEHLPDGGVVGVGGAEAHVVGDAAADEERPLR